MPDNPNVTYTEGNKGPVVHISSDKDGNTVVKETYDGVTHTSVYPGDMKPKPGYFITKEGAISIKDYTIFETKSEEWWTDSWSLNFIRDNAWEKAGLSVEKKIWGNNRFEVNVGGGFLHDTRENDTKWGGVVSWRIKW